MLKWYINRKCEDDYDIVDDDDIDFNKHQERGQKKREKVAKIPKRGEGV